MTDPTQPTSTHPATSEQREQARRLALDALAADSEEQALQLAAQALALDSDCADALLVQAHLGNFEEEEYVDALRAACAAAERSLGPPFIEQHRGDLAKQELAHPCLRARHQLALALIESEDEQEVEEANHHLRELIDLTGDDELGCRYVLLGSTLIDGDYAEAQALLDRFREDQSLTMQLGRAVVAFQQNRRNEADAFLRQAQQKNRNLHAMLNRPEALTRPIEREYAEGSPDEARHSLQIVVLPLADDSVLIKWLMGQTQTPGRNDACPCGSGKKYKNCCGQA